MSQVELILDSRTYGRIRDHLSGGDGESEEAAFLFCSVAVGSPVVRFAVEELTLLPPEAFAYRSKFYLELRDETRAALIKQAHDLGCSLVEIHSHPGQLEAEFSSSDLLGFNEFVPHVRWRLKGRPYLAIVWGEADFDALSWVARTEAFTDDVAVVVDGRRMLPSGKTTRELNKSYE